MNPLLVTPAEAAKILGVSRSTLYELLASKELPSVKIGASRRVRTSDLSSFVERLAEAA